MCNQKNQPIIILQNCIYPYLGPGKNLLLHSNGNLSCGDFILKRTPSRSYYKNYYNYMFQYLKKKRKKLDVTYIKNKDLGDIIESLQFSKRKSISLNKLVDIYSRQGQIAAMKQIIVVDICNIAYKRWWKEYRRVYKIDWKLAKDMHNKLQERNDEMNILLNTPNSNIEIINDPKLN